MLPENVLPVASCVMILGTQWYIVFNVIAGAAALPSELRDCCANLQVRGWLWWRSAALPAVFPFYVTGAITASGVHSLIGRAVDRRPRLITASRSHMPNSSGRYELIISTAFPAAAHSAIVL